MKIILITCISVLFVFTSCSSRKMTTSSSHNAYNVPSTAQSDFSTRYPGAKEIVWVPYSSSVMPIDWDMTDWAVLSPKDYTVTYNMEGRKYYSWYDANGNWIGSSYEVNDNNGLPTEVNNTLSTRYQDYKIIHVDQVEWHDKTAYFIKMNSGDKRIKLFIDSKGNVIKERDK